MNPLAIAITTSALASGLGLAFGYAYANERRKVERANAEIRRLKSWNGFYKRKSIDLHDLDVDRRDKCRSAALEGVAKRKAKAKATTDALRAGLAK